MNVKEIFRRAVQRVSFNADSNPEMAAAYDELRQRQQDFELAEEAFTESATLYLKAAEAKLNELIRQKKGGGEVVKKTY